MKIHLLSSILLLSSYLLIVNGLDLGTPTINRLNKYLAEKNVDGVVSVFSDKFKYRSCERKTEKIDQVVREIKEMFKANITAKVVFDKFINGKEDDYINYKILDGNGEMAASGTWIFNGDGTIKQGYEFCNATEGMDMKRLAEKVVKNINDGLKNNDIKLVLSQFANEGEFRQVVFWPCSENEKSFGHYDKLANETRKYMAMDTKRELRLVVTEYKIEYNLKIFYTLFLGQIPLSTGKLTVFPKDEKIWNVYGTCHKKVDKKQPMENVAMQKIVTAFKKRDIETLSKQLNFSMHTCMHGFIRKDQILEVSKHIMKRRITPEIVVSNITNKPDSIYFDYAVKTGKIILSKGRTGLDTKNNRIMFATEQCESADWKDKMLQRHVFTVINDGFQARDVDFIVSPFEERNFTFYGCKSTRNFEQFRTFNYEILDKWGYNTVQLDALDMKKFKGQNDTLMVKYRLRNTENVKDIVSSGVMYLCRTQMNVISIIEACPKPEVIVVRPPAPTPKKLTPGQIVQQLFGKLNYEFGLKDVRAILRRFDPTYFKYVKCSRNLTFADLESYANDLISKHKSLNFVVDRYIGNNQFISATVTLYANDQAIGSALFKINSNTKQIIYMTEICESSNMIAHRVLDSLEKAYEKGDFHGVLSHYNGKDLSYLICKEFKPYDYFREAVVKSYISLGYSIKYKVVSVQDISKQIVSVKYESTTNGKHKETGYLYIRRDTRKINFYAQDCKKNGLNELITSLKKAFDARSSSQIIAHYDKDFYNLKRCNGKLAGSKTSKKIIDQWFKWADTVNFGRIESVGHNWRVHYNVTSSRKNQVKKGSFLVRSDNGKIYEAEMDCTPLEVAKRVVANINLGMVTKVEELFAMNFDDKLRYQTCNTQGGLEELKINFGKVMRYDTPARLVIRHAYFTKKNNFKIIANIEARLGGFITERSVTLLVSKKTDKVIYADVSCNTSGHFSPFF